MQKTIQVSEEQMIDINHLKTVTGIDVEYKLFSRILDVGIKNLLADPSVPAVEVNPADVTIPYEDLIDHLYAIRRNDVSAFLPLLPWRYMLTYERAVRPFGEDPMTAALFNFHFLSKMAYLLYIFSPAELERLTPSTFIPPDIYTSTHPLIGVLEDIVDVVLDNQQRDKVKQLLLSYRTDVTDPHKGDPYDR